MDLDLSRVRHLSRRFGWVDRRIFWDGHLARMSQVEVAVYLVLCVVADRNGLCWCTRKTLAAQTKHSVGHVQEALRSLTARGLIAVQGRFIQVLDIENATAVIHEQEPVPAQTSVTDSQNQTAPVSPCHETAAVVLARLDPDRREELLKRARTKMSRFLGCREPLVSAVEAVAAGLLDEGVR
jgi:hypothetical protein